MESDYFFVAYSIFATIMFSVGVISTFNCCVRAFKKWRYNRSAEAWFSGIRS